MTWVLRHGKFIESNNKKYEISLPIYLILKVEINKKKIHDISTWPNINERNKIIEHNSQNNLILDNEIKKRKKWVMRGEIKKTQNTISINNVL